MTNDRHTTGAHEDAGRARGEANLRRSRISMVGLGVLVTLAGVASADYHDGFSDGSFWQSDANGVWHQNDPQPPYDPNLWDIDQPHWNFHPLLAEFALAEIIETSVVDKALRLYSDQPIFFPGFAFLGAGADDEIHDANVSTTHWDDTTDHYLLCKAYYPGNLTSADPNDPNNDCGNFMLLMHTDTSYWTAFMFVYALHNSAYLPVGEPYAWPGHQQFTYSANLMAVNGTDLQNIQRIWIDPNGVRDPGSLDPNTADPNDTTWLEPPELDSRDPNYDNTKWLGVDIDAWERTGLWLLMQFESDGVAGDPHGKILSAAIWHGDKFDWDGTWLLSYELSDPRWDGGDPNGWYWTEGRCGVASASTSPEFWGAGFPADVAYDDFEVRTGVFANVPRHLKLKIANARYGTVTIDPDLPDPNDTFDPNAVDPNDPNTNPSLRLLRYTDGTEIVLSPEPLPDRGWRHWKIWDDPNHYPDPNHQITDTNAVLYLTIDKDYVIEAVFSCSASDSALPPIAMVLLLLTMGTAARRAR